jgi:hypothetical protein
MKFISITFTNSVPISQQTCVSSSEIKQLMLLKVIKAVYSENNKQAIDTLCGQNAEFTSTNYLKMVVHNTTL